MLCNTYGASPGRPWHALFYLMLVAIESNFDDRVVPKVVTAPMITTAMRAAMRPYSIAVAPDSSFAKCINSDFMSCLPMIDRHPHPDTDVLRSRLRDTLNLLESVKM